MSEPKKAYRIEGRPQTIYRVVKNQENPYVMIDRRPIDNPKLSYKAKGILTYLMSRPDGWEVSVIDLINHGKDGEDGVRSGLKELKDAGHVRYTSMRNKGRITGWLIEVFEVPLTEKPDREKPDVALPDVENPTQVLSTLSSNELSNKSTTTAAAKPEAFTVYESNIGPLTPIIADSLRDVINDYSEAWVIRAITEAAQSNARNYKYILGVLRGYKERGGPDIGRDKVNYKTKKQPLDIGAILGV